MREEEEEDEEEGMPGRDPWKVQEGGWELKENWEYWEDTGKILGGGWGW